MTLLVLLLGNGAPSLSLSFWSAVNGRGLPVGPTLSFAIWERSLPLATLAGSLGPTFLLLLPDTFPTPWVSVIRTPQFWQVIVLVPLRFFGGIHQILYAFAPYIRSERNGGAFFGEELINHRILKLTQGNVLPPRVRDLNSLVPPY